METKEVKTAAKETAKEKPSPRRYTASQQAETAAAEKRSVFMIFMGKYPYF